MNQPDLATLLLQIAAKLDQLIELAGHQLAFYRAAPTQPEPDDETAALKRLVKQLARQRDEARAELHELKFTEAIRETKP